MIYKLIKTATIITILATTSPAFADNFYDTIQFANPLDPDMTIENPVSSQPKKATLTQNNLRNQYAIAFDRFMQSNVRAAYNDYKVLIETMNSNDYAYMVVSEKMAALGFFDLSALSSSKISDKDYSGYLIDDIQRFYFPTNKLKKDDEIYLAEIFSNITYNDQSKEATSELIKNTLLLTNSDYANYIAALGSLKSNNIIDAEKYINVAISMNNENLNYKKLKAEILSQGKNPRSALIVVEYLKKQNMYSTEFNNKINSLEQYILYKTSKKDADKSYHLGYYYYYENDLTKSARTLQSAVMGKKKANKEVYALLSRVYFNSHEFEKAIDNAQKATKLDCSNNIALEVLGDLNFRKQNYKEALKYYKAAASRDKKTPNAQVKVAQTYKQLGAQKKALEIYSKILKSYTNCYIAYYEVALSDKSKEFDYLKKSIAVNKDFKDGWIDLARVEIEKQQLDKAKQHLAIVNYIDENDFRYYYYQGLILKSQGLKNDADYNFRKSLLLNPNYSPAKKELSI